MVHVTSLAMTTNNVKLLLSQFKCQRCKDSCCLKVTDGIALKPHEDEVLAGLKGVSQSKFKEQFTFTKDNKRYMAAPCPFYEDGCSIYFNRPQVCRQYPFNRSHNGYITVNPNCPAGRAIGEKHEAKI